MPAVTRVLPDVPYQFCHTHFLKNCAKPLQDDLSALQASIRRRAEKVREIACRLESLATTANRGLVSAASRVPAGAEDVVRAAQPSAPAMAPLPAVATPVEAVPGAAAVVPAAALSETELVLEACELVRVNSRVSGKAPLDPAELSRHQRLEEVRELIGEARKKTELRASPVPGPCSRNSTLP